MDYTCENCLYCDDNICLCRNSELHKLHIPYPDTETCNCHVPWWQEGYRDYGMSDLNRG